MRAVTFQSIERMSSPGWYSLTSSNSIPCPLKTLWYSPEKRSFTRRLVMISIRLTLRRTPERSRSSVCSVCCAMTVSAALEIPPLELGHLMSSKMRFMIASESSSSASAS